MRRRRHRRPTRTPRRESGRQLAILHVVGEHGVLLENLHHAFLAVVFFLFLLEQALLAALALAFFDFVDFAPTERREGAIWSAHVFFFFFFSLPSRVVMIEDDKFEGNTEREK